MPQGEQGKKRGGRYWYLSVSILGVMGFGFVSLTIAGQPDAKPPTATTQPPTLEDTSDADEGKTTGRILTLDEAYHAALVNEEQIKIAERELAKAQLLPWRAVALLTPRAEIDGTFTRNKEEISFLQSDVQVPPAGENVFGVSTSVIRPLESWQGIFAVIQPILQPSFLPTLRLGKDAVRQNEQSYSFTMREVLFGVAGAYYDALRSREQVRVALDTLHLTQDELRQARARFRVGEVTKTDVLRAEVAVARAERTVIANRNILRLSYSTLARTIGEPEPLQVVEPTPLTTSGKSYEQLLEAAFRQRQDLRAQAAAVDIARERKNQVLARYAPNVNAQWQFPRLDSPTFANPDKFWTLTLNFQVPLFDGGIRELDLQEQNENLAQAQLQFDKMKKDVSIEVRRASLTAETLEATLTTLKKEVALAQENYTITSKQYAVGLATSLDVTSALNNLNQVQTQMIDQTYAYQVALLAIDRAIGSFGQSYLPQR